VKAQELRSLLREDLLLKQKSLIEELAKLNMQRYGGNVEKPHKFSLIKRDIARIRTILNSVRTPAARSAVSNGVNQKKDK